MNFTEVIIIVITWMHVMSTITWIGGNIFFFLVIRPVSNLTEEYSELRKFFGKSFSQLVELSMWILIFTGAILTLDNLDVQIGQSYVITLAIKILMSFLMFLIALQVARKRRVNPEKDYLQVIGLSNKYIVKSSLTLRRLSSRYITAQNTIFFLGPIVVLLGILLRAIR